MANTWYIITYVSYSEHHDREVYCEREVAYKRYEQLCSCPAASKIEIRKSNTLK